jgi:hypothetical protein
MRLIPWVALSLLMSAAALAGPANPINIAVHVYKAQAVLKVNGIPLDEVKAPNGSDTSSGTEYALLSRNGDNKIEVVAAISDPDGHVELMAYKSLFDDPKLYDEKLTSNGTLTYTLHATDFPEWSWTKADSVADGRAELLNALAEYHQAYAKRDEARIEAFEKPVYDDALKTGAVTQAQIDQELKSRPKFLASAKLRPLPADADLVVESYLDGHIYTVTDKNNKAPVQFERLGHPDQTREVGKFWSRIGGKWYVVKNSD